MRAPTHSRRQPGAAARAGWRRRRRRHSAPDDAAAGAVAGGGQRDGGGHQLLRLLAAHALAAGRQVRRARGAGQRQAVSAAPCQAALPPACLQAAPLTHHTANWPQQRHTAAHRYPLPRLGAAQAAQPTNSSAAGWILLLPTQAHRYSLPRLEAAGSPTSQPTVQQATGPMTGTAAPVLAVKEAPQVGAAAAVGGPGLAGDGAADGDAVHLRAGAGWGCGEVWSEDTC